MDDVKYEYGCEVTSTKECPLREEIRADAIDEVWKLSKEQSVVDAMGIRCIDLSVLDLILEQLKEQNNGKEKRIWS